MKEKISKLTKEELRESDLVWAKFIAEVHKNMRLNGQKRRLKNTASEKYKQIKKEIKASSVRQLELYRQYEAQRRSEQADVSEVAK